MKNEPRPYIVRQGDYLTKLAHIHGFDAEAVWDDPRNAELKKRRPDPDLLAPGDLVYLPVSPKAGLRITKGTTNRYTASVPRVTVLLVLRDGDDNVLADEPYTLEGLGDPIEGKSGADGSVSISVPVHVREVTVVVPAWSHAFPVRIGDLDPIEEASGVRMRLVHLGYLAASTPTEDDGGALRRAIEAFQIDNALEATGSLDDATRDALRKSHGS